jgi:hypothetical protein
MTYAGYCWTVFALGSTSEVRRDCCEVFLALDWIWQAGVWGRPRWGVKVLAYQSLGVRPYIKDGPLRYGGGQTVGVGILCYQHGAVRGQRQHPAVTKLRLVTYSDRVLICNRESCYF